MFSSLVHVIPIISGGTVFLFLVIVYGINKGLGLRKEFVMLDEILKVQ